MPESDPPGGTDLERKNGGADRDALQSVIRGRRATRVEPVGRGAVVMTLHAGFEKPLGASAPRVSA